MKIKVVSLDNSIKDQVIDVKNGADLINQLEAMALKSIEEKQGKKPKRKVVKQ